MQQRKNNRLSSYDYSLPGAYFITVCADRRRCLFSDVGALHEAPVVKLKEYGKMADAVIGSLPERFPITVDKYVIMPNHIHLLLSIHEKGERAIRESPLRQRSLISKVIGYFKMNVTRKIRAYHPQETVWQRSYYDHVIRTEQDYQDVWQYIDNNPLQWQLDHLYVKGASS